MRCDHTKCCFFLASVLSF